MAADRDAKKPSGRQALLEAAVRIVAAKGLDGVSYGSVAQEAGMTPGSVFYHFGSRDALIFEAAQMAGRRALAAALPLGEGDHLDSFLDDLSTTATDDVDDHVFQYEMAFNVRRRPELAAQMQALYSLYCEETSKALRSIGVGDVTPPLARLIFAIVDGLVLQQIVFGDPAQTDESVRSLRELLRPLIVVGRGPDDRKPRPR